MWQPTPMQDLLEKVPMGWNRWHGLESGYFYVSTAWLPIVNSGCAVWEQCDENKILWGKLFVSGSLYLNPRYDPDDPHEWRRDLWQPTVYQGKCVVTGVEGDCWQMRLSVSELTFITGAGGHAPSWPEVRRVRILGREAEVTSYRGFWGDNEPNWKTEFYLKFDDGTRFTAYWGQFEVIE